jgi:hypothetical protein
MVGCLKESTGQTAADFGGPERLRQQNALLGGEVKYCIEKAPPAPTDQVAGYKRRRAHSCHT